MLIVSLILVSLNRTGRTALIRYVYLGLGLAVLASLAGAAGFSLVGFDPENEILEGTLLAVAAVLVTTLLVWMWRTSRNIKRYIETRLYTLAGESKQRQGWGLLGFTFFMVFREGIEIVLFLMALSLTATDSLLQFIGGITGLGLAVLFGFLLIKGSVRIDLQRFFSITGLVLIILVVRFLVGSVYEFSEAGLLPSIIEELAIINFIVKDSTSVVILIVLILLPFLAMLPGLRGRSEKSPSVK